MNYWYLCVFPLEGRHIDIFGKTLSLLHNKTSNHTSVSVSLILTNLTRWQRQRQMIGPTWQERRSHKARGWAQQGRAGRRWRCGSPRWRRPPRPSYFLVSHLTHLERHCSLDSLDLKIPKAFISASHLVLHNFWFHLLALSFGKQSPTRWSLLTRSLSPSRNTFETWRSSSHSPRASLFRFTWSQNTKSFLSCFFFLVGYYHRMSPTLHCPDSFDLKFPIIFLLTLFPSSCIWWATSNFFSVNPFPFFSSWSSVNDITFI